VNIEQIDPTDGAAFGRWFAALRASSLEMWPGEPGWQPSELRARALDVEGPVRFELLAAVDSDGTTVGSGGLECSLTDNRHLVQASVDVHPEHRRRGAGSALVKEIEHMAQAKGRGVVAVMQEDRLGADERSAGRLFAAHHGYEVVLENIRRDLTVPVEETRLAALEAACWPHAAGYTVTTFRDRWHEEDLEDRALFGRRMSTDAPTGGMDYLEEEWDVARVRSTEALIHAMDRSFLVSVARHGSSSRLVAFTEITIPLGAPQKAYQWDTLVLAEHRGHRLGTLVKVANLGALAEASPGTSTVSTMNAKENKSMIAVNEALGCKVVSTARTWQKSFEPQASAVPPGRN